MVKVARALVAVAGMLALAVPTPGLAGVAVASAATPSAAPAPGIVAVPVRVAVTGDGDVGYREIGSGPPLLLIMGLGGTMDDWSPSFVDALAAGTRS